MAGAEDRIVIVIHIKYERDKPDPPTKDLPMPAAVTLEVERTAYGSVFASTLRAGESVEHRLRVVPCELLKLTLLGSAESYEPRSLPPITV
jgi:hypothetical protein